MAFELIFYSAVEKDIDEAKFWYYNQSPGLELRFADDVKNTLLRLTVNPYVHAIRYRKNRIVHTDVFPYSIHFYIDETIKHIVIVGITHNNRNPSYIKQRKS